MLWTPICDFNWQSDNIGTTFTNAGLGTQLTAGGTNHTKNSTKTSILSALTYDCYWLVIGFVAGAVSGSSRRFLTDIYTDPAGGTSWGSSPLIANLGASSPDYMQGGVWYRFPIFIKAGTSIGATCQAETASATVRIIMIAYGQPSHPEQMKVGTFVRTLGATTGTTVGTAMTPGASGAMGSFANLGTNLDRLWWWQMAMLINDTTQTAVQYWCDLAGWESVSGDSSLIIQGAMHTNVGTAELAGLPRCGGIGRPPYKVMLPSGHLAPAARCACSGTADSNISAIAYGVGG